MKTQRAAILYCATLALTLAACDSVSVQNPESFPATVIAKQAAIVTQPTLAPAPTSTVFAQPSAISPSAFDFSQPLIPNAIGGSYLFTEGPAADQSGNVYFSDINAGKIFLWKTDGTVSVFKEGLNGPNGLMFDREGNLIACEGGNGRLISIDPQGEISVVADQFQGVRFNEPNDLWIDPKGGIYFTDPAYQSSVAQDGQHVYYVLPDRFQVIRVISDMVQPNGIVGAEDGSRLYVADYGAGQTYVYDIAADGSLANKQLFVGTGSDGMTLDAAGNLYLTTNNQVQIYGTAGNHLRDIPLQENPTNVTFAGEDGRRLFITARTTAYTVRMTSENPQSSNFTLASPEIGADGLLPKEYTCDGVASTLPIVWSGAPSGTASYAVIMHHEASPTDIHWYWVLFDIPASITALPKNVSGIGVLGNNSVNGRTEYAPPCSKGPGPKTYILTVYALSREPSIAVPASKVDRATLLDAIRDITLASAELRVTYSRQ